MKVSCTVRTVIEHSSNTAGHGHNERHRALNQLLVDRAEAAHRLGLSVRELDRERAAGNILAKRKGSKVLIPVSELERFAAALPWDEPKGA